MKSCSHVSVKHAISGFCSKTQQRISSILGANDMVLERSTFNPNTLGLAQALLSAELPAKVSRLYDWFVLMHGIVIKFLKFT